MPFDSAVLNQLANLTEKDLRRDLDRVRAKREALEAEEQVLRGMLDLVATLPAPPAVQVTASDGAQASEGESRISVRLKGGPSSKRTEILQIIGSEPGRLWRAPEIHAELEKRGITITPENTRVTLRRMVGSGQLEKRGPKYRLIPLSAEGET